MESSFCLTYGFTYAKGELTAIRKIDSPIEAHVHTKNSGTDKYDSYYPSQSGSLHSISAEYDKYGRLTAVAGVLSHAYDVWPSFSAIGGMTGNANNGSARLAMTTDLLRGEAARFTYNEKGSACKRKSWVGMANK